MTKRRVWKGAVLLGVGLACGAQVGSAEEPTDLERLRRKVDEQGGVIHQQQATIQQLVQKVAQLETRLEGKPAAKPEMSSRVSLESEELPSLPGQGGPGQVAQQPWYQNIHLGGFGAAGFIWTGGDALRPHGGFLNHQVNVELDAQVWENLRYVQEIRTVSRDEEQEQTLRVRQAYVNFTDPLNTFLGLEGSQVGTKLGRLFIPFGEDYFKQDTIDNPLITLPAGFVYGLDEGLVVNGQVKGVHWLLGVMDGSDTKGLDDNADKFISLKLYGNPTPHLYLSASGFRNGESAKSAMEFGGSHLAPVGAEGLRSTLGKSTSRAVDAYAYELDAKYSLEENRYLAAQLGSVFIRDGDSTFDRKLYYFQIEPKWNLGSRFGNKLYVVGRVSAIGTFGDRKGYAFAGEPFAGGDSAFGFDAKALYRYGLGLGYWPNPRTLIKVEYSVDNFEVIDASPLNDGAEQRDLLGFLVATKF